MMHRLFLVSIPTLFATALLFSACGGSKKSERQAETVVPKETQERSKDNYGQQQQSMDSLNMSPSEQSGAGHDAAVERGRGVQRGDDDER